MSISASRKFANKSLKKRSYKICEVNNLNILLRKNVTLFKSLKTFKIKAINNIFLIKWLTRFKLSENFNMINKFN